MGLRVGFLLLFLPLVGYAAACQGWPDRQPSPAPSANTPGVEGPYRVAAFVPLSGAASKYGREALQGIDLALERAREERGFPSVEVIVGDSTSETRDVLERFELLLAESHPVAVIGPLLSKQAIAVASVSMAGVIPVISPSALLPNPHELSPYLFSTAYTFQLQAQHLAEFAVMRAGYHRIGILSPHTGFGRELARLFATEVRRQGGEVLFESIYTDEKDVDQVIARLKIEDVKRDRPGTTSKAGNGARKKASLSGFDAIFLPGSYRQAMLAAWYLRQHGVRVPLLGSNSWNSADLALFPEPVLTGSVFVDSFFPEAPDPAVQAFVQRARTQHGSTPSMVMAHAYEAACLVLDAIRHGAKSGAGIRAYFDEARDLPTLSGPGEFTPQGVLNRRSVIVQVRDQGKLALLQ